MLSRVDLSYSNMMFGACSKAVSGPPSGSPIGGPCQYVDIPSIARVLSVEEADPTEYNCANAVKVTFDFAPNNPAAVDNYRFPKWRIQVITLWLVPGLVEGNKHACVRSEITGGTCTPVISPFPRIKMEGWEEACFEK